MKFDEFNRTVQEAKLTGPYRPGRTPAEKFRAGMKRAGYDMDAAAKRMQDFLDRQAQQRAELDQRYTDLDQRSQKLLKEYDQYLIENLRKWFQEKWVRFGPDGKIRGQCARDDASEGKPKCLPQSRAHALGKKGRKTAASRKRRQDPNPERSGPAINVKTKESQQGLAEDVSLSWSSMDEGLSLDDKMAIFEEYAICGNLTESINQDKQDYFISLIDMSDTPVKNKKYIVAPLVLVGNKIMLLDNPAVMTFLGRDNNRLVFKTTSGKKTYPSKAMRDLSIFNTFTFANYSAYDKLNTALSLKFDFSLPSINIKKGVAEERQQCPECGGPAYSDRMLAEKQDACYHKVKSRYKVWPSAYASGALVQCRKKGAKNWGNKSK